MTFCENEEDKSKTIERYEEKNNKLIIYYLDGSYDEFEKNDKLEEEILIEMYKQALKRDKEMYFITNTKHVLNTILHTITLFIAGYSINNKNMLMLCATFIYNIIILSKSFGIESQVKELRKYRTFIKLYKLTEIHNTYLTVDLEGKENKVLDINNIDELSNRDLKEITKIYKKIIKENK